MTVETTTIEYLVVILGIFATVVGIFTGLGTTYYLRLKDKREARQQKNDDITTLITVKDATIESLETQVGTLIETLNKEREDRAKSDERHQEREAKYETRLSELERDYRNLVLTVTTMGFCANATTCPNNDPGDRRKHKKQN